MTYPFVKEKVSQYWIHEMLTFLKMLLIIYKIICFFYILIRKNTYSSKAIVGRIKIVPFIFKVFGQPWFAPLRSAHKHSDFVFDGTLNQGKYDEVLVVMIFLLAMKAKFIWTRQHTKCVFTYLKNWIFTLTKMYLIMTECLHIISHLKGPNDM